MPQARLLTQQDVPGTRSLGSQEAKDAEAQVRAERILIYSRRYDERRDIFTGEPIGDQYADAD